MAETSGSLKMPVTRQTSEFVIAVSVACEQAFGERERTAPNSSLSRCSARFVRRVFFPSSPEACLQAVLSEAFTHFTRNCDETARKRPSEKVG